MESITVRTTLDLADWNALVKAHGGRVRDLRSRAPAWLRAMSFLLWVAILGGLFVLMETKPPIVTPNAVFATIVVFGLGFYVQAWINRRLFSPESSGAFLGTVTFGFDEDGFTVSRVDTQGRNRWPLVKDITSSGTHIFLWVDAASAYVIPVRDLPAQLTADEFIARLKAFMAAASKGQVDETPVPLSSGDVAISPATRTFSSETAPTVFQELRALVRLEALGSADPAHLHGRDITIAVLGGFGLALWIVFSRLTYWGENPQFFWYGLGGLAQLAAWPLLSAWLLSRATSPNVPFRRTLLLVLGAMPLVTMLLALADCLPENVAVVAIIIAIAVTVRYLLAGTKTMTGRSQGGAVAATTIVGVAVLFLFSQNFIGPSLWFSPDRDEDFAEDTIDHERLQFEQAARIDARVAAMPASTAETGYFVGFAGFGEQRVFAEEIAKASQVIGARYGTNERSLSLVNDRRDLEKNPLASGSALRHALTQLGKRMDRDSDVLFLSLSSHGSEDATISVSNGMMYWNDLSAESLREMLDQSGIRWRVIIVSACHAGSFIEPLKNDETIILTAAAKERTSFGCSDDRDLTYFGEALYRDALPDAATLRAAFDAARESIAKREKAEGITESDPQAWFGPAMEAKLAGMEPAS